MIAEAAFWKTAAARCRRWAAFLGVAPTVARLQANVNLISDYGLRN